MYSSSFKGDSSDNDFFPLTVNYIEKFYSVGKIPGGYLKERDDLVIKKR